MNKLELIAYLGKFPDEAQIWIAVDTVSSWNIYAMDAISLHTITYQKPNGNLLTTPIEFEAIVMRGEWRPERLKIE